MVGTHIGWMSAAYLAYRANDIPLTLLAAGTVLFSSTFHLTGRRGFEIIDTTYAVLYLGLGPLLLSVAGASLQEWLLGSFMTVAALAIYIISTHRRLSGKCLAYVEWHALWHIAASMLTLFIYGIYLNYWHF
jgi:hypothetical protein